MKKFIILAIGIILGIIVGIGVEFIIPKSYYVTVGAGCIQEGNLVFMPELRIYDTTGQLDTYPIRYGGNPLPFVPSYRYAYALIANQISILNQDQCNALVMKILEHE